MIRKTLIILSLIGLLLSVGLWGVSYFDLTYCTDYFLFQVRTGRIGVLYMEDGFPMMHRRWRIHGFDGLETDWLPEFRTFILRYVLIPLWMPCLVFAALPAYSLFPIRRRRKRKNFGLCVKCGYSLKGLTELRCPECNTPFEKTCSERP